MRGEERKFKWRAKPFWARLAAAKRCDLGETTVHSHARFLGLAILFQYELSPRKSNPFRHDLCTLSCYQSRGGKPLGLYGWYSLSPLLLEAPALVRQLSISRGGRLHPGYNALSLNQSSKLVSMPIEAKENLPAFDICGSDLLIACSPR